ncbi:hypothetical protein ACWD0E_24285, partial [Streptomyces sp. NPDC003002]
MSDTQGSHRRGGPVPGAYEDEPGTGSAWPAGAGVGPGDGAATGDEPGVQDGRPPTDVALAGRSLQTFQGLLPDAFPLH